MQDFKRGTVRANQLTFEYLTEGDGPILIAHDWGAVGAWGAAGKEPDRWRRCVVLNIPPFAIFGENIVKYDQIKRSFYFWYFQNQRVAEDVIRTDDFAFIDRIWADWSPGYDASEDLPKVKECIRDPAHFKAALGYYWGQFDLSSRILLRLGDLDRSRRFYRDLLGLAIYREFGPPDDPGLVFFLGQGLLEVSGHATGPPGSSVMIWIQVRDVHAEHARLAAAGVPIVREPVAEPWGLIEMQIEDPDGIRVTSTMPAFCRRTRASPEEFGYHLIGVPARHPPTGYVIGHAAWARNQFTVRNQYESAPART